MDRANVMALQGHSNPTPASNRLSIPKNPSQHSEATSAQAQREKCRKPLQFRWAEAITKTEWAVYRSAIKAIKAIPVPFLLGGGFALASFTGRWRDTKDIDFYILPEHRDLVVRALSKAGLKDYFPRVRYDRKWIYRSVKKDVIVDIIWSMANRRARVDQNWFAYSREMSIRGEKLAVVPIEEFLWCKLYILQRDHCDWTDIFNLLYAVGPQIDWNRLIQRLGPDLPLLQGMLSLYSWLCPKQSRELPKALWRRLGLRPSESAERIRADRISLLDSRAWFAPLHPGARKLDV